MMINRISHFFSETDGPTAVEYAVMLACIIVLCIAGITLVGGGTMNFWSNNQTRLEEVFGDS